MRDDVREQRLIGLCILLDDTRLGDRHETIMHLVHSARRASRARESRKATAFCLDALKQLRRARHSLRVAGADIEVLAPVDSAIAGLLPVYREAQADALLMMMVERHLWRALAAAVVLPAGIAAVLYAMNMLLHTVSSHISF